MGKRPVNLRLDEDLLAEVDQLDGIDRTTFVTVAMRALLDVWPPTVTAPAPAAAPEPAPEPPSKRRKATAPKPTPAAVNSEPGPTLCPTHGRPYVARFKGCALGCRSPSGWKPS